MGSIRQGILGGFSGKVGTVIGASWKGIAYMRGRSLKVKNSKTLPQLKQRKKFALAIKFLSSVNPYLKYGFKNYTAKQTAINAAMSYMMHNECIVGEYPNYTIDYSKVKVSLGQLKKAEGATATLTSGTASFSWTDNSGNGNAESTDLAMALLYNKEKKEVEYDIGNATRADGVMTFSYPNDWQGDSIEVYMSLMSENGQLVSESEYMGEVVAGGEG